MNKRFAVLCYDSSCGGGMDFPTPPPNAYLANSVGAVIRALRKLFKNKESGIYKVVVLDNQYPLPDGMEPIDIGCAPVDLDVKEEQ